MDAGIVVHMVMGNSSLISWSKIHQAMGELCLSHTLNCSFATCQMSDKGIKGFFRLIIRQEADFPGKDLRPLYSESLFIEPT